MKQIETLVEDIYNLLDGKNPSVENLNEDLTKQFGERMERLVKNRLLYTEKRVPRLSPSNIGKPCEREVWYSINYSEEAEVLRPEVKAKFLYGDIIEELMLFLAEASGHMVTGRQDRVEIEGIYGNRDAIIDGVLVDVKSASTYSFQKFKNGTLANDDSFGYIGQIQTYLEASQDDPLLLDKTRCAFFVMDKTLGHICLDIHKKVDFDVKAVTRRKVEVMKSKEPLEKGFTSIDDGYINPKTKEFVTNGNKKLGVNCSYCAFKHKCWDDLRVFISSKGPVFFTKVVKQPKMEEVTVSDVFE